MSRYLLDRVNLFQKEPTQCQSALAPGGHTVAELLHAGILLAEEWDELPADIRRRIVSSETTAELLHALGANHLLTPFQSEQIASGRTNELVIAQYRILDHLGHGGMGVVYRAEHRYLRKQVAIKVMTLASDHPSHLQRFYLEARAVARLQHPNLVSCLDAGRDERVSLSRSARDYYVMELVQGDDLARFVSANGPIPIHRAAGVFRQVSNALSEAHRHGLVHRDIKPSNIVITPDWHAKVLDFGLALHPRRQMTEPGTLLGTVGYMAPEQASDPSGVDARADLFSLGATMFLAVTGRPPFPESGSAVADLTRRLTSPPPRAITYNPAIPVELDELLARLMDPDPQKRYPSAAAVGAALVPLARFRDTQTEQTGERVEAKSKVLIVDDDATIRVMITGVLRDVCQCDEAENALVALDKIGRMSYDLIIVDHEMPGMTGSELIARVRGEDLAPQARVLLLSGALPLESLGGSLLEWADDFVRKPFRPSELRSRVRAILNRLTGTGQLTHQIHDTVRITNACLQRTPSSEPATPAPASTAASEQNSLLVAVSRMREEASLGSQGCHARLPKYIEILAGIASKRFPAYIRLTEAGFLARVRSAAILHDLGLVAVCSTVLNKPARLDAIDWVSVQTHTTVWADVLQRTAIDFPDDTVFLTLAADIARHHHERWDGTGYPDGLAGDRIPISARLVAVATVYDALRCRRPYRPALTHARATRVIVCESEGHFDPQLIACFAEVADQFEQVFTSTPR